MGLTTLRRKCKGDHGYFNYIRGCEFLGGEEKRRELPKKVELRVPPVGGLL